MSNREKVTVGIAVSAVAVAIIVIVLSTTKTAPAPQGEAPGQPSASNVPKGPITRQVAPSNVIVPGKGSINFPAGVAVPQQVYTAGPANTSQRVFNIRAEGDKFTPNTVIVKVGDTVDITIAAVDKNYDFTLPDFGFKERIAAGKTKRIQFEATVAGKFTFYCAVCGWPSRGPVGYLVIAEK